MQEDPKSFLNIIWNISKSDYLRVLEDVCSEDSQNQLWKLSFRNFGTSYFCNFEILKLGSFETLKLWNFGTSELNKFETSKLRNFESLKV